MGYANPAQTSRGLHLRQFSRTFIFEDQMKNRVVFINLDACMFSQGLKLEVTFPVLKACLPKIMLKNKFFENVKNKFN